MTQGKDDHGKGGNSGSGGGNSGPGGGSGGGSSGPGGGNGHEALFFFMDAKKIETDKASLTGLEIKQKAGTPGDYQVFLEGHGNDADRAVSDTEAFRLEKGKPLHFYSVPPATFGYK